MLAICDKSAIQNPDQDTGTKKLYDLEEEIVETSSSKVEIEAWFRSVIDWLEHGQVAHN